ncbi:MAG: YheC/YheD family protein [Clostridia bacterium]
MTTRWRYLGIIAYCNGPTFTEKDFYRHLTLAGRQLGIRVFVFSPRQVDFETRTTIGYEFEDGAWMTRTFDLPKLIYDRCFMGPAYRHYKPFIEKLQNDPTIRFMGRGLSGKWQVYQMLEKLPELSHWLPDTRPLMIHDLVDRLNAGQPVIIKPMSGTHGYGVVRIQKRQNRFEALGRSRRTNVPFRRIFADTTGVKNFVQTFTVGAKFLIQPYLSLSTPDGTPFDIRVLVQKDGTGTWQTTGKAVRLGNKQSITSNLHGGGRAVALPSFLSRYFPSEQQTKIEAEIDALVSLLPPALEEHHGTLFELGIDIGVDSKGKVWLIEVNSRPGRAVFKQIHDKTARIHSVTQPVKYANYLMKERVGGY